MKDGSKSLYNKEKYRPLLNAPFLISNECCNIMKKGPMGKLKEYPIIATMVEESKLREQAWLKSGCNSFDKKIQSKPLSFWTKQDVLQYLKSNNINPSLPKTMKIHASTIRSNLAGACSKMIFWKKANACCATLFRMQSTNTAGLTFTAAFYTGQRNTKLLFRS